MKPATLEAALSIPEVQPTSRVSASVPDPPFVSVVIPCRNEEKYIAACLDSLLANDYPGDRMEILVVDGMSHDATRQIVAGYARRHPCIRLVENPARSIPAAMNRSLAAAHGEILVKIDAHSRYRSNHIRGCVQYQKEWGAENVGGILEIQPGAPSGIAAAIALALAARFGSGNARIKTRVRKPTWSDSVAFGCYRKAFLQEIGGFNENLTGSSDMDLNRRIHAAGGRILLVPEVVVDYVADATLPALWRHNFADGVWTTYVVKFGSRAWSWRHWVPLALVMSLILALSAALLWPQFVYVFLAIVGGYAAANLSASAFLAAQERNWRFLFLLPPVFAARHFSHGFGALYGALLLPLPGIRWKGRRSASG